ncbi:unnamed protein product [Arctia plantaginis]|uniref:Uncharacterized protein n=1 Tax=Arctia plantaginis TaxID=874455 RepID=A0A8S1B7V4_ARCPL|nr:unnamed protein product [Arctia plantaginis]
MSDNTAHNLVLWQSQKDHKAKFMIWLLWKRSRRVVAIKERSHSEIHDMALMETLTTSCGNQRKITKRNSCYGSYGNAHDELWQSKKDHIAKFMIWLLWKRSRRVVAIKERSHSEIHDMALMETLTTSCGNQRKIT